MVMVHRKLHQSGSAAIYSGVHLLSGMAVALKKMELTSETSQQVRNEIANMGRYGNAEGVLGLCAAWCEHCNSPPCGLLEEMPQEQETVFYTMPLAEDTFKSFPFEAWSALSLRDRLEYFQQTLVGLSSIHGQQMVHGAISPSTLMLLGRKIYGDPKSARPVKAAISALRHTHSPDRFDEANHAGPWIAPEVRDGLPLYTKQSDIWSLAVTWLDTFRRLKSQAIITKTSHSSILQIVDRETDEPFRSLLKQMLAWNPDERPDAERALAHGVWTRLLETMREEESENRQSRHKRVCRSGLRQVSPAPDDD
ncbi:hypothetical protein DHEL01_v211442 [Diaporthe helianthi]|uniref:Protein kinase domain-containing protein n=1 Tax=Diaporthe helianthi TaxID=158607 RepID=A0A2P5HIT7_DIAHE|nr:hypothetical protein DHEL01_v211442 [Diaporthe helianthi]